MNKANIFASKYDNSEYPKAQKSAETIVVCLILALLPGLFYLLMGTGVIRVPYLSPEEAPPAIAFIAGGCYMLGSLLILVRKRWLWIIGLVMNTLVMTIFFLMYLRNPEIIFSFPGLATKIPQIILEFGLIYLIINYQRKPKLAHHIL